MSGDLPDDVKIRKDLLWGMYTDLRTHARHAETLRVTVVNVMIVVASVLIAVITNDDQVQSSDLPLCVAVVLVGLFGFAFAASYTELHQRNWRRAVRFREQLDQEFLAGAPQTLASLVDEADIRHQTSLLYRRGRRLAGSTQRFWLLLPASVVVAGVILTVVAL